MVIVQSILDRKGGSVVSIPAADSVLNAAHLMNEHGIGCVVVIENGEMVGIFTERDVLRRVVAERRDPALTIVRDVMTSPVITCRAEASLEACQAVITEKRIRHLPVVDDTGLVGIITSGDIMAGQVVDQEAMIQHLNSYIFNVR